MQLATRDISFGINTSLAYRQNDSGFDIQLLEDYTFSQESPVKGFNHKSEVIELGMTREGYLSGFQLSNASNVVSLWL